MTRPLRGVPLLLLVLVLCGLQPCQASIEKHGHHQPQDLGSVEEDKHSDGGRLRDVAGGGGGGEGHQESGHHGEDPRYSERTQLSNLLDSRRERTQLMNNKVLEGKIQLINLTTQVLEGWGEEEADMGNGVAGGETASLGRLRSKSMSRGLPKKASRNAGIIKAHYDAVQQRKKNTSRQASLRSGNLAMTVEEEDEKEEEEQEEVKRRHFTMPESVV